MMIPFAFIRGKSGSGIVSGIDGDLVILSGQTIDIPEGSVKQYSSINIATGGTLRITGNTGLWTEIGVAGNFVNNGQVIARAGYDGQSTHNGGTFTKISAFGLGNLSYVISQAVGGAGGRGSNTVTQGQASNPNAGLGGSQLNGIGGGGGGGAHDFIGVLTSAGETSTSRLNTSRGGVGGSQGTRGGGYTSGGWNGNSPSGNVNFINGSKGQNYTNRTQSGIPSSGPSVILSKGGDGGSGGGGGRIAAGSTGTGNTIYQGMAAGGGGGYKGHHGKGLLLYVEGTYQGTGTILCSGRSGFNGGDGGNGASELVSADEQYSKNTGGGGGGGAGGSGGRFILRYGALGPNTPSVSVSGGSGGLGGLVGTAYFKADPQIVSSDGLSGSSGNNGTTDIQQI